MASEFVAVSGVAKSSNPQQPFAVACELICGQLGRTLGIPIPPGFIIDDAGVPWHVSLDFNLGGQQLPPADAAALAQQHPRLAAGIVVFDSWIVNGDRHPWNLAHDQSTGSVHLFDHSHAFYATSNGRQYLEGMRESSLVRSNCVTPFVADLADVSFWLDRVSAMPDFVVEDSVHAAVEVGLPAVDKQFCVDFLKDRRVRLRDLLRQDQAAFTRVPPALWAQF
jgi:hypothetical protein